MEYKELSKLYYMNDSPTRDSDLAAEEKRRRTAASTFDTGYETPDGTLFVAMPRELTILAEKIMRSERRVSKLMESLPPIARRATLRALVFDEIMNSNTMEGVHSTRAQVREAVEEASGDNVADKRFRELARLYLDIIDSQQRTPRTAEDIRKIYDRAISAEISPEHQLDGTLFRKNGVDIVAGGMRIVHKGLEPEEKIIAAMDAMLALINSNETPELIGAIASHYLFEYAHPFYDGNGRTGRYLLSLFLSEVLSKPTALSLSRTIAENTTAYYRAFKTAEHPLNKGELTFFVYEMLSLVQIAQQRIIVDLESNIEKFEKTSARLSALEQEGKRSAYEMKILSMMAQYKLFALHEDVPLADIASILGLGIQMTRKHIAKLEKNGVVEKRKQRKPITFALSDTAKERLGI